MLFNFTEVGRPNRPHTFKLGPPKHLVLKEGEFNVMSKEKLEKAIAAFKKHKLPKQ